MKYIKRLAHERHRFIHYPSDPNTLVGEETPVLRLPIREGKIPFTFTSRKSGGYARKRNDFYSRCSPNQRGSTMPIKNNLDVSSFWQSVALEFPGPQQTAGRTLNAGRDK